VWTILSIGNKDPVWVESIIKHYDALLKPVYKIKYIDCYTKKSLSNIQENDLIQKNIPKKSYIIGLDILGLSYTSEKFAHKINNLMQTNYNICFIIGGSEGLNSSTKELCNELLSLSSLTMAHKLAKVILIEQLYRASCILTKHPYHK
jgi:23S rRNA (pseudouridine1915-N3)-methyltransferase